MSLQRLLAIARSHGFTAWIGIKTKAVFVVIPWTNPQTGEQGEEIRRVNTLHELKQALGY